MKDQPLKQQNVKKSKPVLMQQPSRDTTFGCGCRVFITRSSRIKAWRSSDVWSSRKVRFLRLFSPPYYWYHKCTWYKEMFSKTNRTRFCISFSSYRSQKLINTNLGGFWLQQPFALVYQVLHLHELSIPLYVKKSITIVRINHVKHIFFKLKGTMPFLEASTYSSSDLLMTSFFTYLSHQSFSNPLPDVQPISWKLPDFIWNFVRFIGTERPK